MQQNSAFLLYCTWGSSMFPFIRAGDCILVKKVPTETIRRGDTIVFESDTKAKVCHRVVEIEKRDSILWFYTGGYKNTSYDTPPIRQEKVLGKVVAIKRKFSVFKLSAEGLEPLLLKFDCLFTKSIFYIKKILAKIPFLKKIYRCAKQKMETARAKGLRGSQVR
jgi:signal peptidase I